MSTYTDMIRAIATDQYRVNRAGEMLGELTAAELAIAYDEHGLEVDNAALDSIDDLRAWCAEQDPLRAFAKLRRLRLVIDESLTSCVAADVCADRIPDDYDDKYAYAANEADSRRDADIADGMLT